VPTLPTSDALVFTAWGQVELPSLWPSIVRDLITSNERDECVLTRRFNLDGQGKFPLTELGKQLKISRERVRQIEGQILQRLSKFLQEPHTRRVTTHTSGDPTGASFFARVTAHRIAVA
jgi:hypothetical protein